MAIAFASKATTTYATASSITITKPTGLAAGDLLFAIIHVTGAETVTTPSGWTQLHAQSHGGSTMTMTSLYKIADSADAAASNFTFNLSGAQYSSGILMRITGTAGGTVVAASDNDTLTNDGAGTFSGGVTPTQSSSLLIMAVGLSSAQQNGDIGSYAIATSSPTWSEELEDERNLTDGSNFVFAVAYGIRTEVTATGDYSFSYGGYNGANTDAVGQLICINPAISVTVSPSTLTSTGTVNTPTISGGATVSPSTLTSTGTVNEPTAGRADWSAQGKSTTGTWSAQSKS